MRVRRLTADSGEHMIGRVLGPAEVVEFRNALGLAGGPGLTPAALFAEIMDCGAAFPLATNGDRAWRLARRSLMGAPRLEIEGPADGDVGTLKRDGLRNRNRLMAHPCVRARCGRARTRRRALSARRAGSLITAAIYSHGHHGHAVFIAVPKPQRSKETNP